MDDIIQTVKLEVALDCEQGSTLNKVWSYVELAQRRLLQRNGMDSESVTVDDALKRYLWPFILKLPGMTFINDGTVIYEATSGSAAQSDAANNFLALSASEAESRFPDLIMRASCKAINKVIFGREEGNEKLLRSTNSYKLIQEISRSREKGVTQVQLSKIFGLDPRSTFHFIKNIDGEGLLSKSVTHGSGNTTNLWVLRRFTSDRQDATNKSSAHSSGNSMEPAPIPNEDSALLTAYQGIEDLRKRASDILEAVGSEYMLETDLMDALKLDIWSKCHRKYFHRAIGDLAKGGFVEKVQIQLPNADLSGFRPEMYRPVAEPMDVDEGGDNIEPVTNALDDDKSEPKAPESTSAEKTRVTGSANRNQTREEKQGKRLGKDRSARGLLDGHSYRHCVRFIKPYVEKGSVRIRLGIPLEQSTRADNNTLDDGDNDAAMADPDDGDIEGCDDSSSDDDDELNVETMRDKDDILYVMKNHSVQVGALATLPPEAQVFRLIALSGSHGIVSRAIQFLLKWVSLKHLTRCLNHLEQTPVFLPDGSWPGVYTSEKCKRENREHMGERLVISVEEFMGREHRKRFFVNPLAKMAIASLTAHGDRGVTQPPTSLSQPALPTQSSAASDSTALVTAAASGNRDDSSVPSSREPAMPTAQPETQSPAPVAATLAPGAELLLADMANFNGFSDICAEAKGRGVPVNTIFHECVILGMLRQESVFACNTEQVVRCDQLVKSYVMANRDSPAMTPTLSKSFLDYLMDLRTFRRTVSGLADQNRLWTQDVEVPHKSKEPTRLQIAISRDTDPDGPVVKTFIAQLCDPRRLHKQITVTAPRRLPGIVPVVRTAGAKERDQDFLVRTMDTDEARARGVKNISKKSTLGRKYIDSNSSKRPLDLNGHVIIRGPKACRVDFMTNDTPIEDLIDKRLQHVPLGIGRAKNLYDYLANNLADNVDNTYVYENCAFRSSFLFHRLPLELFLQSTGGIAYFQDLLPFIHYGICTRVDATTRESVEAQIVDAQNSGASSLKSINERLATPVNKLTKVASEVIDGRCDHVSQHIRSLVNKLVFLQLLRPIYTVKDIVSMPLPLDAKDAFSSVPVTSLKNWATGYQLIGKARILNKKGYDLALDAYNDKVRHRLDLTTCYLGSNVYDMMTTSGVFSYWSDLQSTAEMLAKHLRGGHILFGIGLAHHWLQNVLLDVRTLRILHTYVYESDHFTPLDYPELLAIAAMRAGATLEEARRVFQHQHMDMSKRSYRGLTYQANRKKNGDETIKRVKAGNASGNENSDTDSGVNGGASSYIHGDADSNASGDSVDALTTEYASNLEEDNWEDDMGIIYISSDSDDGPATSNAIDLTESDF
ncbi:hypothetical protein GGI17_006670 [Coemansia sp. S146]|nr:hypothetical protein GGI17_006670 [Coemansia sp. S146]